MDQHEPSAIKLSGEYYRKRAEHIAYVKQYKDQGYEFVRRNEQQPNGTFITELRKGGKVKSLSHFPEITNEDFNTTKI